MPFHIITLPFDSIKGQFNTQELDEFCQHHQIFSWQCYFFQTNHRAFWTCWLVYERLQAPTPPLPKHPSSKKDEPLTDPHQNALYETLKKWRKERALRDGVTTFLIARNVELKEVAAQMPETASGLLAIPGFGKKKVAKYSQEILSLVRQFNVQNPES